ncbi:hypothetical protein Ae201684_001113 [Aphanomyces euteiches]|uniref:Uncharacterized protein n=1 Tax=Aphanomyces euteiches TaxID=100861 RepID=A0A6G0XVY1_9STRA|nr:hypothetical protein Ae201684_001113 [Aphanomyces euteiches]
MKHSASSHIESFLNLIFLLMLQREHVLCLLSSVDDPPVTLKSHWQHVLTVNFLDNQSERLLCLSKGQGRTSLLFSEKLTSRHGSVVKLGLSFMAMSLPDKRSS